jgi:hypothetical protein
MKDTKRVVTFKGKRLREIRDFKKLRLFGLIILTVFMLSLFAQVYASPGGIADGSFNLADKKQVGSGQCGVGCHVSTAGGAISITAVPIPPYTPGENITITVTTSNVPTGTDTIVCIGLYNNATPYPQNIESDGWIITADPNGNNPAFNMNRNLTFVNGSMSWNLTTPSTPGTYYIIAHARHGFTTNPKNRNITSYGVNMFVAPVAPEFPLGDTIALAISALIYILARKRLE